MADVDETTRTWGPVVLIVALLPLAFAGVRACLPPIGPSAAPAAPPAPVGSAACGACHEEIHEAWARSDHALAERPLDAVTRAVLGDGLDVEAVRVIGVDPLWQYLVPAADGRLQVTQTAYDPVKEELFDVFADGRQPGEWGHWTGGAMTWNAQCASCHDTGVDKGLTVASGRRTYATTVEEHGVGCVACHGEADGHLHGGDPPEVPDERWLDVCASCHARRAELTGAFQPGEAFLDHFRPELVDLSEVFYADGQVREEDFEYTAFLGSKMHARGVGCVACHDPHSGDLVRDGDALCLGCHEAMGLVAHDRHDGEVGCASCHMPVTTYMQRDPRHDHGFVVPDPGIEGVPDVCGRCHEDRGAVAAADRWWPERAGDRRLRADRMLAARRRDVAAVPGLLEQLGSEIPAWRASAALALQGFVEREDVVAALVAAADDPSPLVRMSAADALAAVAGRPDVEGALSARLTDGTRAVRVAAARGLRHTLARDDPRAVDYRRYLDFNADQPTALLDAAGWSLVRGKPRQAAKTLERAIAMDPGSPALYDRLATARAQLGDPAGAVKALRAAVESGADDADTWHRLGLAYHGAGDGEQARSALERAVQRDPDHPRAAYNLGILLLERGDAVAAVAILDQAATRRPNDVDVLYGLASAQWTAGDQAAARGTASRVLSLNREHPGALSIVAQ